MLVLSPSWDEGRQAQGMPPSCLFQGWVKFYVWAWCISLEVSLEVMVWAQLAVEIQCLPRERPSGCSRNRWILVDSLPQDEGQRISAF